MKIGNKLQINAFIHCGLCIDELKGNPEIRKTTSPMEYSRVQAGWTPLGLQVWCNRHNVNVVNIDFEGQKHPACTTMRVMEK